MGQNKVDTPLREADVNAPIRRWLADRKAAGQHRCRFRLAGPQGPRIVVDDRLLLNFCSNDYLGLANHPAIIAALKQGADHFGVGSGASQLICGHSRAHAELEEQLAVFTGRDRALLFSTGYMANLAVITAFAGRGDRVLGDRLNHASLIDGAKLSAARLQRYPHADCMAVERLLAERDKQYALVVTDGVFSMDGDIAPVPVLADLCQQAQVRLMVDDAHGFGVLGRDGAGTLEGFGLGQQDVPVLMATFGKALGGFGAFVAGDEWTIERLIQAARPYIYTTAPPPALAVAASAALRIIAEEPDRRECIHSLIAYYKAAASERDLPIVTSDTPIQPLLLGDADRAVRMSEALRESGYFVAAIRPPTVPDGTSRLRITLTAIHSHEQIDGLLDTLARLMRELP